MEQWVQNLCFTVTGAVLGIGADEVKRWRARRSDLELAKREIYDELATYVADLERIFGDSAGQYDFPITNVPVRMPLNSRSSIGTPPTALIYC